MGSTQPKPSGVTEIFSEYVRQRQQGGSPQEALALLRPILERLRSDAKQQLAALIRSWEAREGIKYNTKPQKQSAFVEMEDYFSNPAPDEDLSWLPETKDEPPPAGSSASVLNNPVHPSVAQMPQPATPSAAVPSQDIFYCPQCGRSNRLGDAYCYSCGTLLNVASTETRDLAPETDDLRQVKQSYFTDSSVLLLHVRGSERAFAVPIQQKREATIGRASSNSPTVPDIDLTPYNAADFGVSRIHAKLRYQDNTVSITDLDSVNHTYINGQRLHPHEVLVLRDGDEIRLGRLAIKITFQHQVRHLR